MLQANARLSEEGGDWSRLLIEFRVIAARDPALNARYAALHAHTLEHFTEAIASILARGGLAPAYPPRAFAELILAIDTGRVLEMAAGTAELQLEHLIDLLGRALVPLGLDDDTARTPHPQEGTMPTTTTPKHSFHALRDELQAACWPATPSTSSGWAGAAPRSPRTNRTSCAPCWPTPSSTRRSTRAVSAASIPPRSTPATSRGCR